MLLIILISAMLSFWVPKESKNLASHSGITANRPEERQGGYG